MLSKKYINSVKNLPAIMKKIVEGTAPSKFTTEHLKKIGFPSSNDRALIGVFKDLGFISENGNPTQRYHDYRNSSKSRQVLGEALKEAYADIFHINEKPSAADRQAITGLFKSTHNVSDQVAGFMANTFLSLLGMADISGSHKSQGKKELEKTPDEVTQSKVEEPNNKYQIGQEQMLPPIVPNLRYNYDAPLKQGR